ncbi:uncharacterized protein SCHCODRAFT_02612001 [Schizophyllum commune H4-8]|uniref:Uncharacterized protein n=1 Tax=Schizophyllum commune (strain H4-8 / FGSC 9210) TaxID=578458 RepID=D8PPB1_SCHCM|nr:uncharacterized protein SCHCODRAFT_02612001 [Schizophyllum commune H4-8]KAI5898409.1 hypothetical protein SCHCODRAFT_02612001 [Schizophyllum commune H4-8]
MSNNTNPYAPSDEPPELMLADRTNFIGAILCGSAWGILLTVAFMTVQALLASLRSNPHWSRTAMPLLAFVVIIVACGTLNFAGNTDISRRMFVENRMYPGGPSMFLNDHYDDPMDVLGNAGYIIANFFADALLLYRCYVVWAKKWWIIVIPGCVFIASTTMSIFLLYQVSQPTESLWLHVDVGLTYFSLSLAVNLLLTLLIVGRLLSLSNQVTRMLGSQHARTYTSVAALLVESAAPYAVVNLIFIVTYGIGSPGSNVVLPVLSQIMCTSSVLIILRVANGRAWSQQTTEIARNRAGISGGRFTNGNESGTMVLSDVHFKSGVSRASESESKA